MRDSSSWCEWVFPRYGSCQQHMLQIRKGLNSVCLGTLHQRIDYGTCLGTLRRITKQPVLSAQRKGTDGIFCQVVGYRYFSVVKECHKLLLLVQAVSNRFFQLAPFLRMHHVQPCVILLQKRQFFVLAVFLAIFRLV